MWIELHQSLPRHPKLSRLASRLRITRAQAAGHLSFLWLWTLDYAPYGDVSAFGPAELTAAADFSGDAELFAQALRDCGWIDTDGKIHGWMDYAGRIVEQREQSKARMRAFRERTKDDPDRYANVARNDTPLKRERSELPNRTLPNRTVPDQRGGGTRAPVPEVCDQPEGGAMPTTLQEKPPDRAVELPHGFPCTEGAAVAAAAVVGCSVQFAAEEWMRAMGRGGRDSRQVVIASWPHYLQSCHNAARSRKAESKAAPIATNGATLIVYQKELDRVDAKLKSIADSYDSHQDPDPTQRAERRRLKERREVLKKLLGVEV